MDKIDWTYITALISITFGWLLNELGQWFRTRKEDRKIKKKILYNLLETNFIFNKLDTTKFIELLTNRILLRIPKKEQTNELSDSLKQQYSDLIKNVIQNNVSGDLADIEEKYTSAVDNLAAINPVTAYRLKGKTKIIETFDLLEEYGKDTIQKFPDEIKEIEDAIEVTSGFLKPEIIKEAIEDLEDEIRTIAFSIGIITWCNSKKVLKNTKDKIREDDIKKIDALIDKLIPIK